MKDTKIFDDKKVRKFFDILSRMGRECANRYKGYDKLNPDSCPCAKDVFIKRTIHKWLKNQYFIWYRKSEHTNILYNCYISISSISFSYGHSDKISVRFFDFSRPFDIWNEVRFGFNDVDMLEGVHCKSNKKHNTLLKLTVLNIPEREFVFKAYDFSKYPKRKKKNEDINKPILTNVSVKAKTHKEAWEKLNKMREEIGSKIIIVPEILSIK